MRKRWKDQGIRHLSRGEYGEREIHFKPNRDAVMKTAWATLPGGWGDVMTLCHRANSAEAVHGKGGSDDVAGSRMALKAGLTVEIPTGMGNRPVP